MMQTDHNSYQTMNAASSEANRRAKDDYHQDIATETEISQMRAMANQALDEAKKSLLVASIHGDGDAIAECEALVSKARECVRDAGDARRGQPIKAIVQMASEIITIVHSNEAAHTFEHHVEVTAPAKKSTPAPKIPPLLRRPPLQPACPATSPIHIPIHLIKIPSLLTPIGFSAHATEDDLKTLIPMALHFTPMKLSSQLPSPEPTPAPNIVVRVEPKAPDTIQSATNAVATQLKAAEEAVSATVAAIGEQCNQAAHDAIHAAQQAMALYEETKEAAKREAKVIADQLWNLGVSGLTNITAAHKITSSAIVGLVGPMLPEICP